MSDDVTADQSYLFGNFVGSVNEIDCISFLWQAAVATAAAPTYFPFFEHGK